MKVLILSCDTGEGHNSAAHAINEIFNKKNISCEIKDAIEFGSEKARKAVASSYNSIIKKVPAFFGMIYKAGDVYSSMKLKSPVYFANSLYASRLDNYIIDNKFDIIICTHLFAMEAITYIRKKTKFSIPCYAVLTDYTCIPFIEETKLDLYFIPHDDLVQEFAKRGVSERLINSSGIPVSLKFSERVDKNVARGILGIPEDKKIFLVMTGGIGCGNSVGLCNELLESRDKNFIVYVLAGRNASLKKEIDRYYFSVPQIQSVSFTDKVNLYMRSSDVMISKAGGLSSTEAAVSNVPLVHLLTIPGCETRNADFFSSHGMSFKTSSIREAAYVAKILAFDKEKSENMCNMQRRFINPHAAEDIVNKVLERQNYI